MKDLIKKAWEVQKHIEERFHRLGKGRYGKILKMARKPTPDEYRKTLLITGIGMIVIGLLGFALYLIWVYLPAPLMELFGL